MRLGSGDPRLQKERKTRLVKLPGGLYSDEDVLLLQFWLADTCTLSGRVYCVPFGKLSVATAAAVTN